MTKPILIHIICPNLDTEDLVKSVIQEAKAKGQLKHHDFMLSLEGEIKLTVIENLIIDKARELTHEIIKELKETTI